MLEVLARHLESNRGPAGARGGRARPRGPHERLVLWTGRSPQRPGVLVRPGARGRVAAQAPLGRAPLMLSGLLAAGTVGFAAVGTLFAALLVRNRSRDVMLPLILLPLVVPVIIAGVRGTNALFQPEADLALARVWLSMLMSMQRLWLHQHLRAVSQWSMQLTHQLRQCLCCRWLS